ncbi:hypothetical protein L226DRAFT_573631 [Lentinus tigrinus ALCF2SS1-7]|uniref:uncharacterized protein n=1 Tax=Lentinus tigrinus ALCF2SS1-7 TaxID=1328758 RepID=UPI0011660250|nr:hypothetical protein L226DRAFT_573631 [Lentinus tigrinus ALCF2SS1-7]
MTSHGALAASMGTTSSISSTFVSDNGTFLNMDHGKPLMGTFTFVSGWPFVHEHIFGECYWLPGFVWYVQPFLCRSG